MTNSEPCGVVLINKPAGFTSFDIVAKIRRLYGTRRVGHTGTLDPMATGVLVVLIGRAAKAAEFVQSDVKTYRATLKLGLTTDTEDITGKVLSETEILPLPDEVYKVCQSFVGDIMQIPPMYSAIKIGGRKLCDIARKGEEIDRPARQITISRLECSKATNNGEYIIDVTCSGGTYIRTLCADIGKRLGCGGVMASLVRTSVCNFNISECYAVDELEAMTKNEIEDLLIPVERLFDDLPKIVLPEFYERLFRSGCEIYQKKINTNLPIGTTVSVYGNKCGFFALGKVGEYENGSALKSVKLFQL